jgi:uncharacterized protein with PIN domain
MTTTTASPALTEADQAMREKVCPQCGEKKPFADFYPKSGRPGKFEASCKKCFLLRTKKHRVAVGRDAADVLASDKVRPSCNGTVRNSSEERIKSVARRKLRQELHMGRMSRPKFCSKCGSEPLPAKDGRPQIQAHHYCGYDRPFDVIWLCTPCHRKETPVAAGARSGTAKISASEARRIKILLSVGMAQRDIARLFSIGRTTVRHIAQGNTWTGAPRWTK